MIIIRKFIFGAALLVSVNCHALTLSQVGNWDTGDQLPKVEQAVDQVLLQLSDQTQKNQLEDLKKKLMELQSAEERIKTSQAAWDKTNKELSQISHSGVDAQGRPYAWSGHVGADGQTDPRWAKAQADQQSAISDAFSVRGEVKSAISSLDQDVRNKIEALIK